MIFSFIIGLILIAGWFLYPIVTGHWPVFIIPRSVSGGFSVGDHVTAFGTVKDIQYFYSIRYITINGFDGAYVLSSKGQKGDWVLVDGYAFGAPHFGSVVAGNTADMSIEANVTLYSIFPLYFGVGLLALAGILFVAAIFLIGRLQSYPKGTEKDAQEKPRLPTPEEY